MEKVLHLPRRRANAPFDGASPFLPVAGIALRTSSLPVPHGRGGGVGLSPTSRHPTFYV